MNFSKATVLKFAAVLAMVATALPASADQFITCTEGVSIQLYSTDKGSPFDLGLGLFGHPGFSADLGASSGEGSVKYEGEETWTPIKLYFGANAAGFAVQLFIPVAVLGKPAKGVKIRGFFHAVNDGKPEDLELTCDSSIRAVAH